MNSGQGTMGRVLGDGRPASAQGVFTGRKQTGVGNIPSDWVLAPICEIAPLQRGFDLPTSQLRPGPHPVVYSNGVSQHHKWAMVKGPGVVTGRSGTIGKVHFIEKDYWPHNTTLWVTSFHENDPKFVYYLYTHLDLAQFLSGSGVPTLNRNDVHQHLVARPSPPEQRAIAEALSDVDGLLAALAALIAKKRAIKQAAMQQLLTGKTRLPGFGGTWGTISLGELERRGDVRLFRGKVISQRDIDRLPGDYPIYSSSIHSNGLFGSYGEYMFDEELITWSVDGGGHFFHRPKHRFSVTNVCGYLRIRTSSIDYRYLAYQLQNLHSQMVFDYTVKAHPSVIRGAYRVALPQPSEQHAIATILSDMDTEIAALERRRDKTRAIKQSMMQQLLTGRVRLVKPE